MSRFDQQSHCPNCFAQTHPAPQCSQCGFNWDTYVDNNKYLEPFTRLGESVTLGSVLGEGGFGIVYSGYLDRRGLVAVKEFFPEAVQLAHRSRDGRHVSPITDKQENFNFWRDRFYQESDLLWNFRDIPSIVKPAREPVEANGTYYLVMERLQGCDLFAFLEPAAQGFQRLLTHTEAMTLYHAVLDALQCLHQHQPPVYHRDITLKNIFLVDRELDKIKLLDFGLAHSGEHVKPTWVTTLSTCYRPPFIVSSSVAPMTIRDCPAWNGHWVNELSYGNFPRLKKKKFCTASALKSRNGKKPKTPLVKAKFATAPCLTLPMMPFFSSRTTN